MQILETKILFKNMMGNYYHQQRSSSKEMFFTSVILSTEGSGRQTPSPQADPPWQANTPSRPSLAGRHPLTGKHPLHRQTPSPQADPPWQANTPPPPRPSLAGRLLGRQTPPDRQTPPPLDRTPDRQIPPPRQRDPLAFLYILVVNKISWTCSYYDMKKCLHGGGNSRQKTHEGEFSVNLKSNALSSSQIRVAVKYRTLLK